MVSICTTRWLLITTSVCVCVCLVARCLAKELHIHYGSGQQRSVRFDDRPLEIQNQFLQTLGYTDPQRIQLEGLSTDLGPLFKFVTGAVVWAGSVCSQLNLLVRVLDF